MLKDLIEIIAKALVDDPAGKWGATRRSEARGAAEVGVAAAARCGAELRRRGTRRQY